MGTLYIVATPIGNLEDVTIRAIKTLFTVDVIACEDTRKTGLLLTALQNQYLLLFKRSGDLPKQTVISYYDEIEEKRLPELISILEDGKNIALVSDAGTPLIADPGFRLVRECIKRNIPIVSIPGPSSVITALTVSGLSTNQFLFLGYLPSSRQKRKNQMRAMKPIHSTVVYLESPHRIKESLEDMKEVFGDIDIVVARELTKIYEEVIRGKISEVLKSPSLQSPKGEFIILFASS